MLRKAALASRVVASIPIIVDESALAASAVKPKPVVIAHRDDDDDDEYQSRGGKLPWVLGAVALAALVTWGVMKGKGKAAAMEEPAAKVEAPPVVETPPPVVETPPVVEVSPPVEPEEVKRPPVVVKPPVVKAVVKAVVNKPPAMKPAGKGGISAETIAARIEKYDAKLAEKERASGNADRELRQMLIQARGLAEQAETDGLRKNLWKYLDEIQHQLSAP